MTRQTFDTLTRRASVLTLGAGLAAVAMPLVADAKQNRKKKTKKKARKKCQSQVAQCEAAIVAQCDDAPDPEECLADVADQLPCCAFLARCDFLALFACVNPPE